MNAIGHGARPVARIGQFSSQLQSRGTAYARSAVVTQADCHLPDL